MTGRWISECTRIGVEYGIKSRTIAFLSPFMVQVNGPSWIQIRGCWGDEPLVRGCLRMQGVGCHHRPHVRSGEWELQRMRVW